VLSATLKAVLIILFISTWTSLQVVGVSTTRFTRRQIEALQYEFEFILPEGARIVHFAFLPSRDPWIRVTIAGIRDLDDFLENNLLFETVLDTRGLSPDNPFYDGPWPPVGERHSQYLNRRVYAVEYRAGRGPHLEGRQIFMFMRFVFTYSADNETAIVEISQSMSHHLSPYRSTIRGMIAINAPIEVFKIKRGMAWY